MKLNLGCGRDIKEGYVNVDVRPGPGVDVAHDLTVTPWPWDAESAEEIVCAQTLQYLPDFVGFLSECHRVLAPGKQAVITVPYYTSSRAHADPRAVRHFCEQTFLYGSRKYREENGLADPSFTGHFEPVEYGFAYHPLHDTKSKDAREFMARHYWNVVNDLSIWLTKAA